ncbi:MAG: phytoene desaturase family protein [Methanomassiliicoccales archaeon]
MDIKVIGAGFGGLSAAALLAKEGHKVQVFEKNEMVGGRASYHSDKGFTFDMGPSWYLMPDVFERFYANFKKKPEDLFYLYRLDPSYRIFFDGGKVIDIHAELEKNFKLFDELETNGADKLRRYLASAKEIYELAVRDLLYRDYRRFTDLLDTKLITQGRKVPVFKSLESFVNEHFQSDEARKIVEYSIGFLGGSPKNTPALYHIMSHIDFNLGVWYPAGGMRKVASTVADLAQSFGAEIRLNEEVERINVKDRKVEGITTIRDTYRTDSVVVNADYAHSELKMLKPEYRTYDERYWEKRTLAPSAFVAYVGVDTQFKELAHHTLFLEKDWAEGFDVIFDKSKAAWPENPSYYVNVPSRTDLTAAPKGCDALFILVPLSSYIDDTEALRDKFYLKILKRLGSTIGDDIIGHVVTKRIFCIKDFAARYNAFKGTALGLTHTIRQTALFRPSHSSKKVKNLFYTGQYCHPGIGVPMTLISSTIVANEIAQSLGRK